ncbi:MAG: pyrroline-5-carboxylate reductase [Actinobacteria bacterium]|nr:pyrroline-5-carboxylate reductase [Actinomycetota bacterium]
MGHDTTVAVIGGGNMGAALVGGLLRGGVAPSDVIIVETLTSRRGELTAQFPGVQVVAEVPRVGAVIVAVKPADVHAACVAAKAAGATRLLSIAAGVTIASLEASSGSAMRVVRAMPNTPAVVGLAATAMVASARADADVRDWARQILESVGIVVEVDEAMLDAFTGLVGFDADTSAKLIAQLFAGSSALLAREPHAAKELRARVTSPNGTTAAGVAVLDRERVRDAIVAAVLAARKRSTELGAS